MFLKKTLFLLLCSGFISGCASSPTASNLSQRLITPGQVDFLAIAARSKILFLGEAHTYASPLVFLAGQLEELYLRGYRVLVLEKSTVDPEAYLASQISGNLPVDRHNPYPLYPGLAENGTGVAWRTLAQAYFRLKEKYPRDPLLAVSAEPLGQVIAEIKSGSLDQSDPHKVLNRRDALGTETVNRLVEEIPSEAKILIFLGANHGQLQDQDLTPEVPGDAPWKSLAQRLKDRWGDRFTALGVDLTWSNQPSLHPLPEAFVPRLVTQEEWQRSNPERKNKADAWVTFPYPVFDVPLELATDVQTFRDLCKKKLAVYQEYSAQGYTSVVAPMIRDLEYAKTLAEAYYASDMTEAQRFHHSRAFSAGAYYMFNENEPSPGAGTDLAVKYLTQAWELFPANKTPVKLLADMAVKRKDEAGILRWKAELKGTPWENSLN